MDVEKAKALASMASDASLKFPSKFRSLQDLEPLLQIFARNSPSIEDKVAIVEYIVSMLISQSIDGDFRAFLTTDKGGSSKRSLKNPSQILLNMLNHELRHLDFRSDETSQASKIFCNDELRLSYMVSHSQV